MEQCCPIGSVSTCGCPALRAGATVNVYLRHATGLLTVTKARVCSLVRCKNYSSFLSDYAIIGFSIEYRLIEADLAPTYRSYFLLTYTVAHYSIVGESCATKSSVRSGGEWGRGEEGVHVPATPSHKCNKLFVAAITLARRKFKKRAPILTRGKDMARTRAMLRLLGKCLPTLQPSIPPTLVHCERRALCADN